MKKILILLISLMVLVVAICGISLNYTYKSGLENMNNGNYEVALKQLRLVNKIANNKTIEEKIELTLKEQEALTLLQTFYERLNGIKNKLDSLEGLIQLDNQAKLLKSPVERLEEIELTGDSKVAILLNELKQDEYYIFLRDDYILGDYLRENYPTSFYGFGNVISNYYMVEMTKLEISGAIDEMLKIETMGLIP